jgi:hypothetical protein
MLERNVVICVNHVLLLGLSLERNVVICVNHILLLGLVLA